MLKVLDSQYWTSGSVRKPKIVGNFWGSIFRTHDLETLESNQEAAGSRLMWIPPETGHVIFSRQLKWSDEPNADALGQLLCWRLLISQMQTADMEISTKGLAIAMHLKFIHVVPISRSVLVDIYMGLLDTYGLRGKRTVTIIFEWVEYFDILEDLSSNTQYGCLWMSIHMLYFDHQHLVWVYIFIFSLIEDNVSKKVSNAQIYEICFMALVTHV